MSAEEIKKSYANLQSEAQHLLLNSGYHRSLVRFHSFMADDFDSQVDTVAKKIRNLEAQMPKEQPILEEKKDESKQ